MTIVAGRKLCSPARPERNPARVDFYIAAICFPIIFLGELPDKTMLASLLLSTRGRPVQVWLGAAAAFTVHVAIAVSAGGALFTLVPHSYLDLVVAGLFAIGAIYAWIEGTRNRDTHLPAPKTARGAVTTAFVVIFLAEWGRSDPDPHREPGRALPHPPARRPRLAARTVGRRRSRRRQRPDPAALPQHHHHSQDHRSCASRPGRVHGLDSPWLTG
jgi:Uncharacterized protein family UPF0016